jgi:hypothetical protein
MKYFGIYNSTSDRKRRQYNKDLKVQMAVSILQKLGVQGTYIYGKIVYDYPGIKGSVRAYTFPESLDDLNMYIKELSAPKTLEKFSMMEMVENNDNLKWALVGLLVLVVVYLMSQNKDVKKMMKKLLK